jgi:hypothetical protein
MFEQQLFVGCQAAQQGFFYASQGNLLAANSCYQQAIYCITQSMAGANQASVFIPDHVYHIYGRVLYCAARAKAAAGDGVGAQRLLRMAGKALSHRNPNVQKPFATPPTTNDVSGGDPGSNWGLVDNSGDWASNDFSGWGLDSAGVDFSSGGGFDSSGCFDSSGY